MKNITQIILASIKGYAVFFGLLISSCTLLAQPYIQTNSTDGLGQYGYLERSATTFTTLNSGTYGNIYQLFARTYLNGTNILTYGAALNNCGGSGVVQVTNNLNFGANAIAGQTAYTSIHADYCGGGNSYGGNPNKTGINERQHFIFQVTDNPADISPNVKYTGGKTVVLSFKLDVGGDGGKVLNRLWIQNDGTISESTEIANDGFKIYYEAVTGSETFDGSETNSTIYGDYAANPTNNNLYGNDALAISIPATGLRCYIVLDKFNSCISSGKTVQVSIMNDGISLTPNMDSSFSLARINKTPSSNTAVAVLGGATTAIPDQNFEQALINLNLDCAIDGKVLTSNIIGVTLLNLRGKNIANLVGINDFINLKYLDCAHNALTSLNISGLTNLWELVINNNLIGSLDVSSSPNLYHLDCEKNQINSLNISGLTNLETLIVWDNKLTSLDVTNNPDLSYLDCDYNVFTSINVSGLTQLNQFYCSGNQLKSLDVRGLSNSANFVCTDNPLLTCILVDNVAAANTATVTNDPTNVPPSPFWQKDAGDLYSYCNCDLTTTWNGASWDNGAPTTGTYAAIIAGPYNVSANISACSLTIKNGSTVTIPSGFSVTLNAPLTVEAGGSFTLSNNANLVQTNKNTVNAGAINVNRDSSPLYRLDYTMWSSPVAAQNLLAFSPLTTVTPSSRFYSYDPATDLYTKIVDPSTTPFARGSGYLIRMPNTDPTSGYDAGTTSIAYPGVFTGVPNTGNVSLAGLSPDKYYAVGNPYPSTISADAFIKGNATNGTLYFWRKRNAGTGTAYATYNLVGSTVTAATSGNGSAVPNGTIQVGQGFIVKTGPAATSLNFTNPMREVSPTSTQFFKTKNVAEKDRVWLNLTNTAGAFSQMLVGYMADATQGVEAGIDGKYFNDSPIALTSNINNEEYTIQGRALPFDGTDVVPLAFKTDVAGLYTIAIDHVDGLFSGSQDVFLKDDNTGTETDLKAGAYTFAAAAGVDNARFSLKYQKTLGVDETTFNDNNVSVYKNKGTLYVDSGAAEIANIKVFDIQGRLIAEQKNVKANSATIKGFKGSQQVLIVKITCRDNKVVSRKVVN